MTAERKRGIVEWIRWGVPLLLTAGAMVYAMGKMSAAVEAATTLPPRVEALERRADVTESQRAEDREMLKEIRQDVKDLLSRRSKGR